MIVLWWRGITMHINTRKKYCIVLAYRIKPVSALAVCVEIIRLIQEKCPTLDEVISLFDPLAYSCRASDNRGAKSKWFIARTLWGVRNLWTIFYIIAYYIASSVWNGSRRPSSVNESRRTNFPTAWLHTSIRIHSFCMAVLAGKYSSLEMQAREYKNKGEDGKSIETTAGCSSSS